MALVGLVDSRGWLLLQERDDRAPMDPNKWGFVGGGVEPGESPGRRIVFVDPAEIPALDLTDTTRALFERVLSA